MQRRKVLLPEPEAPIRVITSPLWAESDSPLRTSVSPKRFLMLLTSSGIGVSAMERAPGQGRRGVTPWVCGTLRGDASDAPTLRPVREGEMGGGAGPVLIGKGARFYPAIVVVLRFFLPGAPRGIASRLAVTPEAARAVPAGRPGRRSPPRRWERPRRAAWPRPGSPRRGHPRPAGCRGGTR